MVGLNLSARSKKRLLVSAVPEWAEEYFCDDCGRDVTKQVRRQQSHSWQPMGAERFRCACGHAWFTGAAEWDHLNDREKRNRVNGFIVLNIFSVFLASIVALAGYFLSSKGGVALDAGLAAFSLFLLFQLRSWFGLFASIWRTKVRRFPAKKES
jgi:hypothetical protein